MTGSFRMPSLSPGLSYTVWVSEAALNAILKEADNDPKRETGGVLMAYWSDDLRSHHNRAWSRPRSRWRRFRPNSEWQKREIARVYQASGRTVTYLGDWHSHPGWLPLPSRLDVRTARRISTFDDARAPNPLMLIVGGTSGRQGTCSISVPRAAAEGLQGRCVLSV